MTTTSGGGGERLLALDDSKAGMAGVDKERIEQVINEASRGSKFYENERRKAAARQVRIDAMLQRSAEFDAKRDTYDIQRAVAQMESQIEQARVFTSTFVHIDMDMFFAAVEEKYDPRLKGVPMAVGGMSMLSTSNYHARKFGVRAAMPGYIALKLCPGLKIVHSHFDYYRAEAAKVRAVIAEYDPNFVSGGLDESCLCLDEYLARINADRAPPEAPITAPQVAEEIRRKIFEATELTASAGIACTAALAKIVSNYNKPNGQFVLEARNREEVMHFMKSLPVRSVNGVGKVQEGLLHALGIKTCGDLYDARHRLYHVLTEKNFQFMLSVALGAMGAFGGFHVSSDDGGRKSVSSDTTKTTIGSVDQLMSILRDRLVAAHETIIDESLVAKQVTLKLKQKTFTVRQYSRQLDRPTDDLEVLWGLVEKLAAPHLSAFASLRLVGVRLGMLSDKDEGEHSSQPTLSQMMRAHAEKKKASNSLSQQTKPPSSTASSSLPNGLATKRAKLEDAVDVDDDSGSSGGDGNDDDDNGGDDDVEICSAAPSRSVSAGRAAAVSDDVVLLSVTAAAPHGSMKKRQHSIAIIDDNDDDIQVQ